MKTPADKIICVIPARMSSVRFPGKPLVPIMGKPMIQRVYERVAKTGYETLVATDDQKIAACVQSFGGHVVLTDANHSTGSSRCNEAVEIYTSQTKRPFELVINVQGDEPLISPESVKLLASSFDPGVCQVATLVFPMDAAADQLVNRNEAYAVMAAGQRVLYFSRFLLPFDTSGTTRRVFCQIGIYAFRRDCLNAFVALPPSPLEQSESLEQNRWLENGGSIHAFVTDRQISLCVDTPDDVLKVEDYLARHPNESGVS